MPAEQDNQEIIRPIKGKGDPDLGPVALMVMLHQELKWLVRISGAVEVRFSETPLYRLYQADGGPSGAPPVALAGPFFGAPHAVLGLEKLIALGVKTVWVLGWCGSLQPDLNAGHFVIPDRAVSEEGTSRHYPIAKKAPEAHPGLTCTVAQAAARNGWAYKKGTVWTTDAIYRETPKKVRHFQKMGVLAVDMEMSALLTVAAYRGADLAALLVVSDELSSLKWKPGFSNPRLYENTRMGGQLLLDLARATGDISDAPD